MAGSYSHVTTDKGKLRNPRGVNGMLDSGGDVFEAVEEMYGMIWWLATALAQAQPHTTPREWVEKANENYLIGISEDSPGRQKADKELR